MLSQIRASRARQTMSPLEIDVTNEKLLERLSSLLDPKVDVDKKHIKKLRKVLQKLKNNQKELKAKLEQIDDEQEIRKLKQEIEVLKLQRKKGVKIYKELKRAVSTVSPG